MILLDTPSKSDTCQRPHIYRRWRLEMRRARLFEAGDRLGVAVSGGQDSMLLLDFMVDYAQEAGLTLAVAHFNHHLRGAEADEDEDFVRAWAERLKLECWCSGARVAETACERKMNVESAGRKLRYGFFCSLLSEGKLNKVATAHTASDQAETVLLRLLRGTGTRGLSGIHPLVEVLGGQIVRPFLSLTRAEVEEEVARRGLAFRTDATNFNDALARNRVRHQVVPLLRREFNPGVVHTLAAFAERARSDESFLNEKARECAGQLLTRSENTLKIPHRRLNKLSSAMARRVVRLALAEMRSTNHGASDLAKCTSPEPAVTHSEIESVSRLASTGGSGKWLRLAGGIAVRKEFDWLVIERAVQRAVFSADARRPGFSYRLHLPCEAAVPELDLRFHFCLADMGAAASAKTTYTGENGVWLDARQLSMPLILRNWRPGDRIGSAGSAKPLKLKELFQRRCVPIAQRPFWPVLEAANEIIWAKGLGAHLDRPAPSRYRLLISEEEYRPDAGGPEKK